MSEFNNMNYKQDANVTAPSLKERAGGESVIIDAHSHLWLRQDTSWNGLAIRTCEGNGSRSQFLGEERQMLPPFMIDGRNTAEVFLSNMNYAQVASTAFRTTISWKCSANIPTASSLAEW